MPSLTPISPRLAARFGFCSALLSAICGCANYLPNVGPSKEQIDNAAASPAGNVIQVVNVDRQIARQLLDRQRTKLFSETLGQSPASAFGIGSGDLVEVTIWEAPPATLFGGGSVDTRNPASVRATTLPEQMVDRDGFIGVPFAGRIRAAGQTTQALEAEVVRRLGSKANHPEVLVRVIRNASSTVTVVGEVANSTRMPLTASGERLLDALAAAGGVRQPVNKMTLQVTRGKQFQSLPLDVVIRDPEQNVPLHGGDVVTALFQPLSFTALGATGKNEEVNFEAQGISLAQALGRAGGLNDARSDAQGVFVFRLEPQAALDWPRKPVMATPDGLVPVVYQVNLRDPMSFFAIQNFAINNRDILYVSNAPAVELQKFLNLVFSVAYPALTVYQVSK